MDKNKNISIKNWAVEDRPRERLLMKGTSSLSPAELIAILIGSGNVKESALELAKRLLNLADNNINTLAKFDVNKLSEIKGIGKAKAVTIVAALELGKRRTFEVVFTRKYIKSSKDAFDYFWTILADLKYEESYMMTLNQANTIITHHKLGQGGIVGTVMDVRIILKKALNDDATGIILAHNHPSGNITPSEKDKSITQKIKNAASVMDIKLLDHIIVTQNNYFSFADNGIL